MSSTGSTPPTTLKTLPDLAEAEALYEQNRFLDLHEASRKAWEQPEITAELALEELVLASRLALRLGSQKLARWLGRLALERAPNNPHVIYYCRGYRSHRTSLYDCLREFEQIGELRSGNPELDTSWLATHASVLAQARDFDSALEKIERARLAGAREAWVLACEAGIHLQRDDLEKAHELAGVAWESSPGLPYAGSLLGTTHHGLGTTREALELFLAHHRSHRQSWEHLDTTLNTALALLENPATTADAPLEIGEALELADELFELAPLCDRAHERHFHTVRARVAWLAGRRDLFRESARRVRSEFLDHALEQLESHPEGRRHILRHDPVHQQYKTCLPASLATCASVFEVSLDHREIASQITYDGTPLWRVPDWAQEKGWAFRAFTGNRESAVKLLEMGFPFIYTFATHSFAHAVAAVGCDRGLGTLIYHDPTSGRIGEVLLDHFADDEAPLGPQCLVVAPPERAGELAAIELDGESFARAHLEIRRAFERDSSSRARELIAEFVARDPDSLQARYLEAWAALETDNAKDVVDSLEADLARHPGCHLLQQMVLNAAWASGDTAYYRNLLETIVRRERQPAYAVGLEWVYPDPLFQVRLASLLAPSAARRDEAMELLEKALYRNPFLAEGYAQLGHELWRSSKKEDAILPYRLAACLEPQFEGHAETHAWALKKLGRVDEAVESLRRRVDGLESSAGGGGTWRTLILALEGFGFPDDALACLDEGLELRPEDGELATFAVSFLARYGQIDRAGEVLASCEKLVSRESYLATASQLAFTRGRIEEALELAREWLEETPRDSRARTLWVQLQAITAGPRACEETLRNWVEQHPDDEQLEELYLDHLRENQRLEERRELLARRIERDDLDAWARSELAWDEFDRLRTLDRGCLEEAREPFREHVEALAALQPDAVQTRALRAEVALLDGDVPAALEILEEALVLEPGYTYAIQRLFELTASRSPEERLRVVEALDRAFETTVEDLATARGAALLIARHLDRETALAALERWGHASPEDPMIIEARADIHIEYGTGRESIEAILPGLELAVERFPLHLGLVFSLADAYQHLCRLPEAIETYGRLLEIQPGQTRARLSMASALERSGQLEEAEACLTLARDHAPLDPEAWSSLADWYRRHEQLDRAEATLREACERIPWSRDLWVGRLQMLISRGKPAEALEVAQELASRTPEEATNLLIAARTFWQLGPLVTRKQTEETFQRSIALNARLWDAVWDYCMYLCDQADFEQARQVVERYRELEPDEVCPRGALACVTWRSGETTGAIREMRNVLRETPDYDFGWYTLMDWLEEEAGRNVGALALITQVLESLPPRVLEDPSLACRRLLLLEAAREDLRELTDEWERLAHNFPGSTEVHLRYFDFLARHGRLDEARVALEEFERRGQFSPQLLARKVCLAVWTEDVDSAVELALDLYLREGQVDPGSIQLALEALRQAKAGSRLARRLLERFREDPEINEMAFEEMLRQFSSQGFKKGFTELMEFLDPARDGGRHLEKFELTLQYFTETSGANRVIEWAEQNLDLCRERRRLWEILGRSYSILERDEDVLRWLSDWRERAGREGVSQWLLNQLAASCFGTDRLEEAMEVALFSLSQSFHDQTACHLAEIYLRSALRLGRLNKYRAFFRKYRVVVLQNGENPASAGSLLAFFDLLEAGGTSELLEIHRESRLCRQEAGWPAEHWKRLLAARLPLPHRLALKLGLLGA